MDKIQTGEKMAETTTKASDIDYNGAQDRTKPRLQTRGTAQLAAGVHLLPTGGIFKSAAVEVLRREQRLMATGEICKLALKWGLLKCTGKTPEATMASSLYGDIKRNDGGSVFYRPRGGMFGLKEWIEQDVHPSEALIPSVSQQVSLKNVPDASHNGQKGKRQTRGMSSSSIKPPASKRPHQDDAILAAGGAETMTAEHKNPTANAVNKTFICSKLSIEQQLPGVLPKDSKNNSTFLNLNSTPPAMGGTLTTAEQQPRRRLLTSESNEVGTSGTIVNLNSSSLSAKNADHAAHAAKITQQDWARNGVAEQEIKVAAVENKWGSLHPRAGQAHLLLYKACKQHAVRFPSVESRAKTALTRAYDIMMFNSQVEELGKLKGLW